MTRVTRICICGGGSLGHVCAGFLAAQPDTEVRVLTQHPERWSSKLLITDPDNHVFEGHLECVSNNPQQVVSECDIILLCLPGFAIEDTLYRIKPHVGQAVVGSIVCSTGFFFAAHRILGTEARLFGFQRTPFIARTTQYGHAANLLGYKPQIAIAIENAEDREAFRQQVEQLWRTPTLLLNSHYEVSLTNSNPILHTGRLYSLWKDWKGEVYDHNILFYKEWTDEASQTLIDMDAEFMLLLAELPVTPGAIPTLLEYYESHDAASLTRKIRSIAAFQHITSPMKEVKGGWVPDFSSRYFTEDFPFGLRFIHDLAHKHNTPTPTIDKVYEWGGQFRV
ncbi:MAG: NAD/NADP octopine/nopaline dehydrogenase family protein [Bacteroidales bacterium]|nr:NAD/NADP octopine/nopaline dehydrogenase family protein [Bacteroidales bacterium]